MGELFIVPKALKKLMPRNLNSKNDIHADCITEQTAILVPFSDWLNFCINIFNY
jgi:hypothetical protein